MKDKELQKIEQVALPLWLQDSQRINFIKGVEIDKEKFIWESFKQLYEKDGKEFLYSLKDFSSKSFNVNNRYVLTYINFPKTDEEYAFRRIYIIHDILDEKFENVGYYTVENSLTDKGLLCECVSRWDVSKNVPTKKVEFVLADNQFSSENELIDLEWKTIVRGYKDAHEKNN